MNSVGPVEKRTVPKQIEIVDEGEVVSFGGELKLSTERQESAEAFSAEGHHQQGATDADRQPKVTFSLLRLPEGCVIIPHMDYYQCYGGWKGLL